MKVFTKENKDLKIKIEELITSTKFMSDMYDENVRHMKEIKEQLVEIKNQNKNLLDRNASLEKAVQIEKRERIEMEERFFNIITPIEMDRRQNNLELHGLPEQDEEDCNSMVKSVLEKVIPGSAISLNKCYRFGNKENSNGKPRRIFIQFSSKTQRDDIFKNRKNLKKLNEPLYLNENLPRYLSILRGKANARRKEKNYKYIWMKNGTILLRENDFSEVVTIRFSSDLDKI